MTETVDLLIIDDDEAFTAVLGRACRRRGLRTAAAHTGSQALALLTDWIGAMPADEPAETATAPRILLDLKLGEQSGLALIEPMLALAPQARIVVLTGYSSIATAVEAVKLGAVQYLCKPTGAEEILAAFEHVEGDANVPLSDRAPSVDRLEWEHIQRILAENQGNVSATARALGMHRRTLQRKLYKRPVRR